MPREEVELEVKLKLMHVRALRIQEMIVLFLFILFSSMKEENLMKFVFQTVFFNITIPISAIQGDLNDIYAERITSNYQEVANGLSKLNSLAQGEKTFGDRLSSATKEYLMS